MKHIIVICAWLGAVCMMAAPFIIDYDEGKILAIVGLLLLTIQAAHGRLYHLICLNLVSIGGFSYALYI